MVKKFLDRLRASSLAAFIRNTAKKITLPGFEKMSLYEVAIFFFTGMREGSLPMRASAVSYNFFLAIFPSIIFVFTLIPYIPIENFQEKLLQLLSGFMPYNAYEATRETIEDIITNQRGGLLSVGFISALYFSTNGINSLITAFHTTYHDIEERTPFQQRLASILLVIIFVVLMVIGIGLIIFSEYVLNRIFTEGHFVYYLVMIGRWIILFALFYSLVSFTYFIGTSRKARWRFASAGSMFATVLSVITSVGFTYYVNNFGNYNKLYGSIGTLIVILLWLYFNSLVLLLGFELNVSIQQAKQKSVK